MSANNMANAVNDVDERDRLEREKGRAGSERTDDHMLQAKQLEEDLKRQQEHANERRREEDRRAQVIAREQDAYDPYAMNFD